MTIDMEALAAAVVAIDRPVCPDHPHWTPTLEAIADAAEHAAAALVDRPDDFEEHDWHLVGDEEGNDEYFVCQTCEVVDFDKGAIKAPWPCAGALEAQPELARLNAAIPVGTTVTFRPNGVGDATVTTTRTPVWIAKDGHSYVSVNAYPPQSGAAVRTDSLRILRTSEGPPFETRMERFLDRHGS